MSKRQFFLGILLASLIGGMVALAGVSYFIQQPQVTTTFEEKQNASFVNLLAGENFTIRDGINFVASAEIVTPAVVHVRSTLGYTASRPRNPIEELFGFPPGDENPMQGP